MPDHPGTVRVMSWNVWWIVGNQWRDRQARNASTLAAHRPDIVGSQEPLAGREASPRAHLSSAFSWGCWSGGGRGRPRPGGRRRRWHRVPRAEPTQTPRRRRPARVRVSRPDFGYGTDREVLMRIEDSAVVITGASSGIGRATAHGFAARGANVALAARNVDALEEVADECRSAGVRAEPLPTDVSSAPSVNDLARHAYERFGQIDIWVNAAAVAVFGPVNEVPLADVRRVLEVNALGTLLGARAALRYMRDRGSGVLINVASVVGVVPQPYTQVYGMSKAAVRTLSGSLRQELRLAGLRDVHVCTVLPASINTPLFDHAANYTGREPVPMPPTYEPERVAEGIVALARTPRRERVVGPAGRLLMALSAVAPALTERFFAGRVDRAHFADESTPSTHGNLQRPERTHTAVHGDSD